MDMEEDVEIHIRDFLFLFYSLNDLVHCIRIAEVLLTDWPVDNQGPVL